MSRVERHKERHQPKDHRRNTCKAEHEPKVDVVRFSLRLDSRLRSIVHTTSPSTFCVTESWRRKHSVLAKVRDYSICLVKSSPQPSSLYFFTGLPFLYLQLRLQRRIPTTLHQLHDSLHTRLRTLFILRRRPRTTPYSSHHLPVNHNRHTTSHISKPPTIRPRNRKPIRRIPRCNLPITSVHNNHTLPPLATTVNNAHAQNKD